MLCSADPSLLQHAYSIHVDNPHAAPATEQQLFHRDERVPRTCIGNQEYHKVFTDGSCKFGTKREMARAGFGFHFAPEHPLNCAFPLDGPVQSSYRAEVKAILHVVRICAAPTVIMCDCQGVVGEFNRLIAGDAVPSKKRKEQDLWDQISIICDGCTST